MAKPEVPEFHTYSLRFRLVALAALATVLGLVWGGSNGFSHPIPYKAASTLLFVALLALAAYDLKDHILPDYLTLSLLVLGLFVSGYTTVGYLWAGLGAIAGYGLIAGLRWFWIRRRDIEAIGLGDAKLLAAGGAWVGASGLPIVLLIASGTALFVAFSVAGSTKRRAIPFGVFLALGIWVSWCLWVAP